MSQFVHCVHILHVRHAYLHSMAYVHDSVDFIYEKANLKTCFANYHNVGERSIYSVRPLQYFYSVPYWAGVESIL